MRNEKDEEKDKKEETFRKQKGLPIKSEDLEIVKY